MTEQQIDWLVADSMTTSDTAVAALDLHGAEQELLEAVMSTPVIDETSLSRVKIPGRAVASVLKENRRHGKTTIDPG